MHPPPEEDICSINVARVPPSPWEINPGSIHQQQPYSLYVKIAQGNVETKNSAKIRKIQSRHHLRATEVEDQRSTSPLLHFDEASREELLTEAKSPRHQLASSPVVDQVHPTTTGARDPGGHQDSGTRERATSQTDPKDARASQPPFPAVGTRTRRITPCPG